MLSFRISSTTFGLPSPTLKICSQGTLFLDKYFAVPSVAIILNPILIKFLAAANASLLSALLTEIKAVPLLGTI